MLQFRNSKNTVASSDLSLQKKKELDKRRIFKKKEDEKKLEEKGRRKRKCDREKLGEGKKRVWTVA
jgi:hypothetical protein